MTFIKTAVLNNTVCSKERISHFFIKLQDSICLCTNTEFQGRPYSRNSQKYFKLQVIFGINQEAILEAKAFWSDIVSC